MLPMTTCLVISDIFGRTPALEQLCLDVKRDVTGDKLDPMIVDPYAGRHRGFETQEQAYGVFMAEVGLDAYAKTVETAVKGAGGSCRILAFSVGAAALWLNSENPGLKLVEKTQLYYGSQIRYSLDLRPCFPVHLIFPAMEPHFDVAEVMRALAPIPNVSCSRSPGLHGFMNPCSPNFDPHLYTARVRDLGRELFQL